MASSYIVTSAVNSMQSSGAAALNANTLKPLDEVLRCRICFDYFTNCMITKCSHNFCSVCIRRYMAYKSQCPTCFQEATEPELQNNRLIDEILRIYKKIRESLQIPFDTLNNPFPEQSSSSKSVIKDDCLGKDSKPETLVCNPTSQQNEVSSSDEVSCPVCYTIVPNSRINIHLDSCLKQSEERSQRKSLPKLVYHLLSDKEIKKKLKEHELSTTGNRQALIRRHKNFIILFNANSDSLNPKPVSDLLLEIERQELEERLNAAERFTQVNKKSDPSVIQKEHESYVQEHKTQFNALIQDVQERAIAERRIKKEVDDTTEGSCNITDESGNLIGKSILRVGDTIDLGSVSIKKEPFDSSVEDPVIVKEELSESLLKDAYIKAEDEHVINVDSALHLKEPDTDFNETTALPFRIKKNLPTVKIKDEPQFLLDFTTNPDCADSQSLDEFEVSKMPINKFHKKKYARKLSTEEKNTQRKK